MNELKFELCWQPSCPPSWSWRNKAVDKCVSHQFPILLLEPMTNTKKAENQC